MASKHLSLLKAAGGEISLHSPLGRHYMRAALLDTHLLPDAAALHSSAMSVGGQQSLHSKVGRFITRTAALGTDTGEFRTVDGEQSLRSALGAFYTPT